MNIQLRVEDDFPRSLYCTTPFPAETKFIPFRDVSGVKALSPTNEFVGLCSSSPPGMRRNRLIYRQGRAMARPRRRERSGIIILLAKIVAAYYAYASMYGHVFGTLLMHSTLGDIITL